MAVAYEFANICGGQFEGGKITFSADGNALIAPTGNRVSVYDLRFNKIATYGFEARHNIRHILVSPSIPLLLAIDETGRCQVVNSLSGVVLNRIAFKFPVSDAKYSPCGRFVVVAVNRRLRIWDAPCAESGWQLSLRREIQQHADRIVAVNWSKDSRFLCTASRDLTVRIFSRDPIEGFKPITFVDHRYPLRDAFFSEDMSRIVSVSRDGVMICWVWKPPAECDDKGDMRLGKGEVPDRLGCGHLLQSFKPQESSVGIVQSTQRVQRQLKARSLLDATSETDKVSLKVEEAENEEVERVGGSTEDTVMTKNDADTTGSAKLGVVSVVASMYIGGSWEMEKKAFCNQAAGALVVRCAFCAENGLLAVGFSNGVVSLYEMPEFDALYTLSVGSEALDAITLSREGDWLGLGSSALGQLIVWEWRSETYILKQQGHNTGVRSVACSPSLDMLAQARTGGSNGNRASSTHSCLVVATGGEDGKVKLWDTSSGFNYVTFTEHTAAVNDLVFTPQGNAVLSASDDGTVRGFDMVRYRNFRTFVAPESNLQFVSIAVDAGGEVVVAGSQGAQYNVFVWSIQSGRLLEMLSGHQASVCTVQFHPHPAKPGVVVSGSWDATLRVWDIYGRSKKGGAAEPLVNASSVLAAAFNPKGNNEVAVATLSGSIWFWDVEDGVILGSINGLRDIHSGRRVTDRFSANNSRAVTAKEKKLMGSVGQGVNRMQHFTSITYSSNGSWLLAASKTSARHGLQMSYERTIEMPEGFRFLGSGNWQCHAGRGSVFVMWAMAFFSGVAFQEFDLSDSGEEGDDEVTRKRKRIEQHMALPGVRSGEMKGRKTGREFHVWKVAFSQDGQQWCAATSHGLYTYTLSLKGTSALPIVSVNFGQLEEFAPHLLTRNVSVQSILDACEQHPSRAMILALALNDVTLLSRVYLAVPYQHIGIVVQSIPPVLLPPLLNFMRVCLGYTEKMANRGVGLCARYIQLHLRWLLALLSLRVTTLQTLGLPGVTQPDAGHVNTSILGHLGMGSSDLKTLFLLLLRSVQKLQAQFSSTLGSNLRTLDFLLRSAKCTTVNGA